MKTFKIFYKWRVDCGQANNAMQNHFVFHKAENEEQALDQFKSEFSPEVQFEILNIVEC